MGLKKEYLLPLAMDKKILVAELPSRIEFGAPHDVRGKSGQHYRLVADRSAIGLYDLQTMAKLEATVAGGLLTFELITRPAPDEPRYNSDFDAKLFVGAAISYLETMGCSLSTWRVEWSYGTNYEQYRENLKNDPNSQYAWSAAAWKTWTGARAIENGYDRVVARSKTDLSARKYIFDFIRSAF